MPFSNVKTNATTGSLLAPINEPAGSNIASASTTNLATLTGNYATVTGTTTITALGTLAAGAERTLCFAGILTLTHDGTSLILPTAANITTAAGDVAVFRSLGSGNWRCTSYLRADGTALAGGGGGGSGVTDTGKTLWVDSVNGNDGNTGAFGDALLTLAAAKTAAASGDVIQVLPGSYTVTDSILKNGVNWHFHAGATVTMTNSGSVTGILDDKASAVTCSVTGSGRFIETNSFDSSSGTAAARHASSVLTIEADEIQQNNTSGTSIHGCIFAAAGLIFARVKKFSGSGATCGVWWTNGSAYVENELAATNYAVWYEGTPGTETHVHYRLGRHTPNDSGGLTIYSTGGDPASALWMEALVLGSSLSSTNGAIQWSYGKCYLTAQKLFGGISASGGEIYAEIQKLQPVGNGSVDTSIGAAASLYSGTGSIVIHHLAVSGIKGPLFVADGDADFSIRVLRKSAVAGEASSLSITCTDGSSLTSGDYFTLPLSDGTFREIWFNVDSGGGAPSTGNTNIEVAVASSDTFDTVAAAIASAINGASLPNIGGSGATSSTNTLTITLIKSADIPAVTDGVAATGFSLPSAAVHVTTAAYLGAGTVELSLHVDGAANSYGPQIKVVDGTHRLMNSTILGGGAKDVVVTGGTLFVKNTDGSGAGGNISHTGATLLSQS